VVVLVAVKCEELVDAACLWRGSGLVCADWSVKLIKWDLSTCRRRHWRCTVRLKRVLSFSPTTWHFTTVWVCWDQCVISVAF